MLVSALTVRAQMPRPVVSPEVSADRNLTLRYRAPDAKQIVVTGELDGKPHPMTKASDGVWTVTIGPLAPDIYTYAFNVDGATALDPQNTNTKLGYGSFGPVSVVEVAGDGPQFYDSKPVAAWRRAHPACTSRSRSACRGRCGYIRRPATTVARTIRSSISSTAPAMWSRAGC